MVVPIKFMKIVDEKKWLEKRKGYLTSTQLSCLFGLQPNSYSSYYETYHVSRKLIEAAVIDNNYMKFGKLIESAFCEMIKLEHQDWIIETFPYFAYDDDLKMGSSFDRIVHIKGRKYLMELKSTTYGEYKKKFVEHSEDDIEAPTHYECQMQGELDMVRGEGFSGILMAVLIVDTREIKYIFRAHDEEMCAELRAAVAEFWSLKSAPEPDFKRDKSLIARLAPSADPQKQMDATQNNRLTELVARYRASKDIIKQEEAVADEAYAEILYSIGDAKYIFTNSHKISVADIKPVAPKIIKEEDVGKETAGKNGFKRLTIKSTIIEEEEE